MRIVLLFLLAMGLGGALACSFTASAAQSKRVPTVNVPTPDADAVHFPFDVPDSLQVCVEEEFGSRYLCEPLIDLRTSLWSRKAAN